MPSLPNWIERDCKNCHAIGPYIIDTLQFSVIESKIIDAWQSQNSRVIIAITQLKKTRKWWGYTCRLLIWCFTAGQEQQTKRQKLRAAAFWWFGTLHTIPIIWWLVVFFILIFYPVYCCYCSCCDAYVCAALRFGNKHRCILELSPCYVEIKW